MSDSNTRPPINFPRRNEPELKLTRPPMEKWTAAVGDERARLEAEQAALREREQNLQKYEQRLRARESELDARGGESTDGMSPPNAPPAPTSDTNPPFFVRPGSASPVRDEVTLQASWDQLQRARALLEAERKSLRDERMTLREFETQVKQRETAVAAREQAVAQREAAVSAAQAAQAAAEAAPVEDESTLSRLTRAPFAVARSVLGKKDTK